MLRAARRFLKDQRGAVIVEFALVVPLLFIIVFGIIDFSRAYAQLNNINSSLREGARWAAAQKTPTEAAVRTEVTRFSSAWANPMDVSKVFCNCGGPTIEVFVTNYPITLPTLGGFLNIAGKQILVSRTVSFRWERAGAP
jgi:Flp pilus assembly protein TadG